VKVTFDRVKITGEQGEAVFRTNVGMYKVEWTDGVINTRNYAPLAYKYDAPEWGKPLEGAEYLEAVTGLTWDQFLTLAEDFEHDATHFKLIRVAYPGGRLVCSFSWGRVGMYQVEEKPGGKWAIQEFVKNKWTNFNGDATRAEVEKIMPVSIGTLRHMARSHHNAFYRGCAVGEANAK
jgi:hypothetical protein